MDSYEQYEKDCKNIRKENEKLLSIFGQWMIDNEQVTIMLKDYEKFLNERTKVCQKG